MRLSVDSSLVCILLFAGSLAFGSVAIGQSVEPRVPIGQDQSEVPTGEGDTSGLEALDGVGGLDGLDGIDGIDDLLEEPALPEIRYDRFDTATLRALDKITGRSTDIDVTVDRPIVFGSLQVTLKSCHQTPPELPPESAAFLEVDSVKATQANVASREASKDSLDENSERLFSGWMFASSPGLSALEHPVYDIWTIRCTTPVPVTGASGE